MEGGAGGGGEEGGGFGGVLWRGSGISEESEGVMDEMKS